MQERYCSRKGCGKARFPTQELEQCSEPACCARSLITCPAASSPLWRVRQELKSSQPHSHNVHAALPSKQADLAQAQFGAEIEQCNRHLMLQPGSCPHLHGLFCKAWVAIQRSSQRAECTAKGKYCGDCGHLLLQPGGCPRSYLGLLLSSLCLAVSLLFAPLQLRDHIHNDLQQPCRAVLVSNEGWPSWADGRHTDLRRAADSGQACPRPTGTPATLCSGQASGVSQQGVPVEATHQLSLIRLRRRHHDFAVSNSLGRCVHKVLPPL